MLTSDPLFNKTSKAKSRCPRRHYTSRNYISKQKLNTNSKPATHLLPRTHATSAPTFQYFREYPRSISLPARKYKSTYKPRPSLQPPSSWATQVALRGRPNSRLPQQSTSSPQSAPQQVPSNTPQAQVPLRHLTAHALSRSNFVEGLCTMSTTSAWMAAPRALVS